MTSTREARSRRARAVVGVPGPRGPVQLDEWRVRRTVVAARSGDRDAMRELYEAHAPRVRAYALRILRDEHDADDVTQQVFSKLLTELDRYRPGEAPFIAWVLRIAHNAAIDHVRRTRLLCCESVPDHERPDDGSAAEEARTSLRAALASLPPAQRDVLLLMDMIGLSPTEIAEHLGRSVRSVHGLHYRGRAAARAALDDLGSAPVTMQAASA